MFFNVLLLPCTASSFGFLPPFSPTHDLLRSWLHSSASPQAAEPQLLYLLVVVRGQSPRPPAAAESPPGLHRREEIPLSEPRPVAQVPLTVAVAAPVEVAEGVADRSTGYAVVAGSRVVAVPPVGLPAAVVAASPPSYLPASLPAAGV